MCGQLARVLRPRDLELFLQAWVVSGMLMKWHDGDDFMAELDQLKAFSIPRRTQAGSTFLHIGCTACHLCQPYLLKLTISICIYINISPAITFPCKGHATVQHSSGSLAGLAEDESQSPRPLFHHHRPTIAAARLHLRSWILPARQPAPCRSCVLSMYTNRTQHRRDVEVWTEDGMPLYKR